MINWKEVEESIEDGTFHSTPTEQLKTRLERFRSEDEHVMNERAQLLQALQAPEALTETDIQEIRERYEALTAGLIHEKRLDR